MALAQVLQELDNFDDNAFEWFESFQTSLPGSSLFDNGVMPVGNIITAFADLVSACFAVAACLVVRRVWMC